MGLFISPGRPAVSECRHRRPCFTPDCPRLIISRVSQSPASPLPVVLENPANSDTLITQSTVLIVDDNAQNVELLQAFLEALPVKLVTAVDGIDALEKVAAHNPDLILLDVMMPRMSGFQVCQKLKKRSQDQRTSRS